MNSCEINQSLVNFTWLKLEEVRRTSTGAVSLQPWENTTGNRSGALAAHDMRSSVVLGVPCRWGCCLSDTRGCLELPNSYVWGNFTVLAVGVWAIAQRDSIDAIIMFLIGLLITILLDIINISLFYPRHSSLSDLERFSSGMAIFSLLLKPLSCLFVYQMYRERGGEYVVNLGFLSVGRDRSSYQSIDQHNAPCPYPDLDSKPPPHPF
ncbi:type-1 angiotensin II receptor-associated protein isoform X1 [Chrysemys picta bellii]|uniref:Angiotensin II receptor associated protein n=3 Tax=Emydidae TaxID=8476 RepID=A0A8C3IDS9_CHRPI|nr:type-1 angiotensin II receptor-associated protein isoform X1 [Chrysemys picta bellii]